MTTGVFEDPDWVRRWDVAFVGHFLAAHDADMATMWGAREWIRSEGGFIAYGPNESGQFKQAADYVDRILKGANPADLPVAQPTKIDLAVNLKTAKALGIAMPETFLLRADEVIE